MMPPAESAVTLIGKRFESPSASDQRRSTAAITQITTK